MGLIPVPDRGLNAFRYVHRAEDGAKILVPFPCDYCHAEPACYGKDNALFCTTCWLEKR